MRFRFCWDCDCPDWLLAEIITLSKIKSTSLKELTLQIGKNICGEPFNYDDVCELFIESDFDDESIKASVAAIRWILSNAAGAQVEAKVLDSELQQLGLPREQSQTLIEVFGLQKEALQDALKDQTFKASENVKFTCDIKEIQVEDQKHPAYKLNLEGEILDQEKGYLPISSSDDQNERLSVLVTHEQLGALIHELEDAYSHMEEMKQ